MISRQLSKEIANPFGYNRLNHSYTNSVCNQSSNVSNPVLHPNSKTLLMESNQCTINATNCELIQKDHIISATTQNTNDNYKSYDEQQLYRKLRESESERLKLEDKIEGIINLVKEQSAEIDEYVHFKNLSQSLKDQKIKTDAQNINSLRILRKWIKKMQNERIAVIGKLRDCKALKILTQELHKENEMVMEGFKGIDLKDLKGLNAFNPFSASTADTQKCQNQMEEEQRKKAKEEEEQDTDPLTKIRRRRASARRKIQEKESLTKLLRKLHEKWNQLLDDGTPNDVPFLIVLAQRVQRKRDDAVHKLKAQKQMEEEKERMSLHGIKIKNLIKKMQKQRIAMVEEMDNTKALKALLMEMKRESVDQKVSGMDSMECSFEGNSKWDESQDAMEEMIDDYRRNWECRVDEMEDLHSLMRSFRIIQGKINEIGMKAVRGDLYKELKMEKVEMEEELRECKRERNQMQKERDEAIKKMQEQNHQIMTMKEKMEMMSRERVQETMQSTHNTQQGTFVDDDSGINMVNTTEGECSGIRSTAMDKVEQIRSSMSALLEGIESLECEFDEMESRGSRFVEQIKK